MVVSSACRGRGYVTRGVLSHGDMTLTSARSWRDTRTAAFEIVEDILFNIPTKVADIQLA